MSPRFLMSILFGFLIFLLAACTDDPAAPVGKDPEPEPFIMRDSVPHDFVVFTEPSPVISGEVFDVTVRWDDSNMNMSGIGMELEGGHVIGRWTVGRDPSLNRYTCSQRMTAPAEFISNLLYISVYDPDSNVVLVHEVDVAGGFDPPENTGPYDLYAHFHPNRITPGQTVSLSLQGFDDENNMVPGMAVSYADGTPIVPLPDTQGFGVNLDAHLFSYWLDYVAPGEQGRYDVEFIVGDKEGETFGWSATFEVEGPNQAPYFTGVWLEDRILEGNSDVLEFRVAAIDPDGDELILMSTTTHGSSEYYPLGVATGDTTVWAGTFTPGSADTSTITFRVSDGNIEVPSDTYEIRVDHSGRPVLDGYFITDGEGVMGRYDPARNAYLEAHPGEAFNFEITAHDPQGDELAYEWFMYVDGYRDPQTSDKPDYRCSMPEYASQVSVFCRVSDPDGNTIGVRPAIIAVF